MIGLDTNVLVRYLTQDDPDQSQRANAIFGRLSSDNPGYVGLIVLVETCWVLGRAYRLDRSRVHTIVEQLLGTEGLVIEQRELVHEALRAAGTKHDLPDALIAVGATRAGATATVTFDQKAADLPGMVGG